MEILFFVLFFMEDRCVLIQSAFNLQTNIQYDPFIQDLIPVNYPVLNL